MAKSKTKFLLIKVSFCLGLFLAITNKAFTQRFYINNLGLHTHIIEQKKDFKIGFHVPPLPNNRAFTAAYSPRKNISLSLGYINMDDNRDLIQQDGDLFTVALGVYRSKEETNSYNGREGIVTLIAEIGLSYANLDYLQVQNFMELSFRKIFSQIGISYTFQNIGFNLKLRYNNIRYTKGKAGGWDLESTTFKRIERIESSSYLHSIAFQYQIILGKGWFSIFAGGNIEKGIGNNPPFFLDNNLGHYGVTIGIDKLISKINNKKKVDD